MKQWIFIVAAMLLIVAGCQRRSFDEGDEGGGRSDAFAIRFSVENTVAVESGVSAATKADPVAVLLPVGTTIRVLAFSQNAVPGTDDPRADCAYILKEDASSGDLSFVPCLVDASGAFKTFTGAKAMELNNGTYDFYAYSPARKIESDSVTVKGVSHGIDFMAAGKTTQAVSRSASEVPLGFAHKSAKVTFSIKSAAGMVAKDSLCGDSVLLRSMGKLSAEFRLGGDLSTVLGGGSDTCWVSSFVYNDVADKTKGAYGSGVLLPKPDGKVPAEFYVTMDSVGYLLKAALPTMPYLPGQNYKFTMLVKQGSVDLVLQIVSWDDVAADAGFGEAGSILVGSWSHVNWSGDMGGNTDLVTGRIQVGTWAAVAIPVDFLRGHGGGVGSWGDGGGAGDAGAGHGGGVDSWGDVKQSDTELGK